MKNNTMNKRLKGTQIYVPMQADELKRLDIYLEEEGLIKGAFVRKAILAYLEQQG